MTNGELFIAENPTIKTMINGSCVWIYYPDGVNHYTMPTSWWEQEISLFDKIRAEIESHCGLTKENHCRYCSYCNSVMGVREILEIIDKYRERSEE